MTHAQDLSSSCVDRPDVPRAQQYSCIRRVLENTSRSCVSAVSCEVRSSQLETRSVHIELYS